ncbi:glycosyltransferase family 2 protein [Agromyces badenianii]|uniref:Glycosyltransferase family 2 protein n=1 Tax=Agromyces badenianii TaxID=2080742 RepID=A0A2S0WX33_9MICO|nr:glycosyltransferase family 2 protein [Agromyces badenianii]AWB95907.1 glycosyltransferase family 2 protein [Agromyces badenianii]
MLSAATSQPDSPGDRVLLRGTRGVKPVSPADGDDNRPALSVVIPSFNSAPWLPSTLVALASAIEAARIAVQVIVVDDGSTDDTADTVRRAAMSFPGAVELVQQPNRGRFLARWEGIDRASAELTLLLDSRVLIDSTALSHVFNDLGGAVAPRPWNAHVRMAPDAPLVGLFWDVPTHIFWGGYLRDPRPMDITKETFDSAPKGTTMFLAPTRVLRDAFRASWPSGDASLMSDDTTVLRWIAEAHPIRIDPGFSATYRPRTTVRGFASHSFLRGTLFVDSYAGTTLARSAVLILLALLPPVAALTVAALAILGRGAGALWLLGIIVALALLPLVPAAVNRCPKRSLLAYTCYLPVFVVPFWAGLVRGIVVHRAKFTRHVSSSESGGSEQETA